MLGTISASAEQLVDFAKKLQPVDQHYKLCRLVDISLPANECPQVKDRYQKAIATKSLLLRKG